MTRERLLPHRKSGVVSTRFSDDTARARGLVLESPTSYPGRVDPLRAEDIVYYGALAPAQRLRLALVMMEEGFAMQRANLRRRHPNASDAELEAMLRAWMCRE